MLREKSPDCHTDMWAGLLVMLRAYPGIPRAVDVPKRVLPVLWSSVRHAFYGSGNASYPALLPLMLLLAPEVGHGMALQRGQFAQAPAKLSLPRLLADPSTLAVPAQGTKAMAMWSQLLRCLWQGMAATCSASTNGTEAGRAAFCECAARSLSLAGDAVVEGRGAHTWSRELADAGLGTLLQATILPAATGSGPAADCAARLVGQLIAALQGPSLDAVLQLTSRHLCAALKQLLGSVRIQAAAPAAAADVLAQPREGDASSSDSADVAPATWPGLLHAVDVLGQYAPKTTHAERLAGPLLLELVDAGLDGDPHATQLAAALLAHQRDSGGEEGREGQGAGASGALKSRVLEALTRCVGGSLVPGRICATCWHTVWGTSETWLVITTCSASERARSVAELGGSWASSM